MTTYVLAVGAELDLDEIWEYIARDSLNAADKWIAKLFDVFDALARKPLIAAYPQRPACIRSAEVWLRQYRYASASCAYRSVTR